MRYDTDLTDPQWAVIAPFIPPAKRGGRPRKTSEREVVNAVFYLLKSGCQWRLLPKQFPPWRTVYEYYIDWREKLVWRKIQRAMYEKARKAEGRKRKPTAVVIDSSSVKTGKMVSVATRGFDGGKKVKGRKRHLVTDTLGLMVDVSVTPANVHDTKGARYVLNKIAKRQRRQTIKKIYADKGYQGPALAGWVHDRFGAVMETTQNLTKKAKKFVPAKKRWVIERTFAWLGDCYRLSIDRERHLANSMTMVRLAFIRLILRRLFPT